MAKTLFVMDPIHHMILNHDGSFALMLEAQARKYDVYWCKIQDLFLTSSGPFAVADKVALRRKEGDHYQTLSGRETLSLNEFEIIWMRTDPPVDANYVYATHLLDHADPSKTLVLNRPQTLRDRNEKLFILDFPEIAPETLVTHQMELLRSFVQKHPKGTILKPLDGFGGRAIFKTQPGDPNLGVILETLTQAGKHAIMAQEYLAAVVTGGDKRIIYVQGRALGAMTRMPSPLDHRANMAAGGKPHKIELSKADLKIVETIAPTLMREGVLFAGLDVIGDRLTEINITSPTGIQEVDGFHGTYCAGTIWDEAQKLAP